MPQRSPADSHPTTAQAYIEAIPAGHWPLLDRLQRLIDEVRPALAPHISYNLLCWKAGNHRLYIGAWKHGLSIYGWSQGRETTVTDRHPGLKTSTGTIRLTPANAAQLTDDELRSLVRAALADWRGSRNRRRRPWSTATMAYLLGCGRWRQEIFGLTPR